jgi:hypothetical protein
MRSRIQLPQIGAADVTTDRASVLQVRQTAILTLADCATGEDTKSIEETLAEAEKAVSSRPIIE